MRSEGLLLSVGMLVVYPSAVLAAPFQNGIFVDPACPSGFCDYSAGSPAIAGWTVSQGNIDQYSPNGGWQSPPPGGDTIDLEGCCGANALDGGMAQTFDTIPGQTYHVMFYMSGNPDGYPVKTMGVTAGTYVGTFTYNIKKQNNSIVNMKYVPQSFRFTANSTETTLNFFSKDTQEIGWGPVIGGVSVLPKLPAGFATVYSFSGGADGSTPNGGLAMDGAGQIVGTAFGGGSGGNGTLFALNPEVDQLAVLYAFTGQSDGMGPRGGLAVGPGDVIYGTTQSGGSANAGTVFAFNSGSDQFTSLYAFPGDSGGADPLGGLVLDNQGNLDGSATHGGANNLGEIFQVNASTAAEKTLYSFPGGSGGSTPTEFTLDGMQNIVGATRSGGSGNNAGELYLHNPINDEQTVLYEFTGGADGMGPNGPLAADNAGTYYGTTLLGGTFGYGTIFKFDTATGQLTTLYSFANGADGGEPLGGLAFDGDYTLYGVTSETNKTEKLGTLFKFDLSRSQLTTLHSFSGGADGGEPNERPMLDADGAIYGSTRLGGAAGFGTIYRYVTQAPDAYAYFSAGNGTFGVVDLNTGAFTPCGSQGGSTYTGPGIGADGNLYAGIALGNTFGTINKSTGAFTTIGNSNISFLGVGSYQGTIYAVQYNGNGGIDLYSVDQSTAAATFIGTTGVASGTNNWPGLSSGADAQYFYFSAQGSNGKLYKLNVATGKATKIKSTTGRVFGAMAQVDGVLYIGVQQLPIEIDSIDLSTRKFKNVSVVNPSDHYLWGMAPAQGATCK